MQLLGGVWGHDLSSLHPLMFFFAFLPSYFLLCYAHVFYTQTRQTGHMHEVVSWSCLYMDQVSCLLMCPCFRKSKQVSLFSNRCYPETEGLHTGFPPPQENVCILQCMGWILTQSEGYGPRKGRAPRRGGTPDHFSRVACCGSCPRSL